MKKRSISKNSVGSGILHKIFFVDDPTNNKKMQELQMVIGKCQEPCYNKCKELKEPLWSKCLDPCKEKKREGRINVLTLVKEKQHPNGVTVLNLVLKLVIA